MRAWSTPWSRPRRRRWKGCPPVAAGSHIPSPCTPAAPAQSPSHVPPWWMRSPHRGRAGRSRRVPSARMARAAAREHDSRPTAYKRREALLPKRSSVPARRGCTRAAAPARARQERRCCRRRRRTIALQFSPVPAPPLEDGLHLEAQPRVPPSPCHERSSNARALPAPRRAPPPPPCCCRDDWQRRWRQRRASIMLVAQTAAGRRLPGCDTPHRPRIA